MSVGSIDATLNESPSENATESAEAQPMELRDLARHLATALSTSQTEDHATDRIVECVRQLTRSQAVMLFGLDDTSQVGTRPVSTSPIDCGELDLDQIHRLARQTVVSESCQLMKVEESIAVGIPIILLDQRVECLVVVADIGDEGRRQIAGIMQVGQLIAAFMGQWRHNFDAARSARELTWLRRLLQAVDGANRAVSFSDSVAVVANAFAERFQSRWVAVGFRQGARRCRLSAISDQVSATQGAPLVSEIETALAEQMLDGSGQVVRHATAGERCTTAMQRLIHHLQAQVVYGVNLPGASTASAGAILIIQDSELPAAELIELLRVAEFSGPYLRRLSESQPGACRRSWIAYQQLSRGSRRVIAGTILFAAILLLVLPVPYSVKCRCDVQPVTRRFIAAPYEGRLQDALVEPGDFVTSGQVLAVMDGSDIRIELSALNAELQRVTKQRDRALANRETAAAQIALLETQRLQSSMQLLEQRLQNLEIRSPADGVVISGDPSKLKGARLSLGQTLLEIGPLGDMVLEVAIPDDKIAQIQAAAPVRFRLDSMPYRQLHGRIKRIHPRSELRESLNIFVADVQITEGREPLRPGMRGRAHVSAGRRSLIWICFHRVLHRIVFALGL